MSFSMFIKKTLKGALLMPVVGIGLFLLWFVFTVLNKAYWDAWVTRMCTSTDLVTVFETVDLSAPAYRSLPLVFTGFPIIPFYSTRLGGEPLYIRSSSNTDRRFGGLNTSIYKKEIVRTVDEKVMSRQIWYGRGGGDVLDIGSPGSSFSCSELGYDLREISRATYKIGEE